MKLLSVIVPCYNEEENIKDFYDELFKNIAFFQQKELEVELLYIDDGSKDKTAEEVRKLHEEDNRVRLVSFSRNFGKEAAIYAGLQKCKGDLAVLMDVDLQDPPSLLPEMYSYIEQGYDSVATRRVTRKGEPVLRSFFARMFYKLMNRISRTEIVDGARDYRLMTRQVVDAILSMTEYNRFTKGIFGWVGYETKWLEYENVERRKGETKWSFWKLFILVRGDHGIFNGAACYGVCDRSTVLCPCLCDDFFYDCQEAYFWRSYFGMAVFGMYYHVSQWCTVVLSGNCGAILI